MCGRHFSDSDSSSVVPGCRGGRSSRLIRVWRGVHGRRHRKVKAETVVADVPAENVADAIREAARTGEPGDGKMFVMGLAEASWIRTGKEGTEAV